MNPLRPLAVTVLLLGLVVAAPAATHPEYPAWWSQRGVIDPAAPADDYAPASLGQLKHFALRATEELGARVPGGAPAQLTALVNGFTSEGSPPANQGQAKHIASHFYDVLRSLGYQGATPWSAAWGDDASYAPVNQGQLKFLFAFSVADILAADRDGDGLSNHDELVAGTDLFRRDTDGDGLTDGWEAAHGLDPLAADATADPDGDGRTALQEFLAGSGPTVDDTTHAGALIVYTPLD